jgi:hypothetical protein
MSTIALGLPHTPWIPERVASFARLRNALGFAGHAHDDPQTELVEGFSSLIDVRTFDDRESNRVWPRKLYDWALSTRATHCLQLQDDVIVYDRFWPVLRAMVEAVPNHIIGLESNHPLGPEMHRTGRRWYRSRAWLVGVGYCWPTDPGLPNGLPQFLKWCDANPALVQSTNEDSLVNQWAATHGFDIWHPVPTIIDHDIGVPSTYGNDDHHEWSMYRRPTVTWRDVSLLDGLEHADYWRATMPPLLPGPGTQKCWFCGVRQGPFTSKATGCRLCPSCLSDGVRAFMGLQ